MKEFMYNTFLMTRSLVRFFALRSFLLGCCCRRSALASTFGFTSELCWEETLELGSLAFLFLFVKRYRGLGSSSSWKNSRIVARVMGQLMLVDCVESIA